MSESVAQDQIKAFVERILRLREEAKAINGDIREVYAEAKGNGFDKTVLGKLVSYIEKRATGAADLQEAEALFDLYLSAYDGVRASHTHTREGSSSPTTNGGDNETSAHPEEVKLDRRRQAERAHSGANADEHQHPQHGETNQGPTESPADTISVSHITSASPHYEAAE